MTDKELERKRIKRLNTIKRRSARIKKRIMQIGLKTGCGHIASALSVVEVLVATYHDDPKAIVILSKGHGALAQYVILEEMGTLPKNALKTYYTDGGLSGHATLNQKYGVYASTGSLGHGLPIGIGYAIANPDRKVVVIMSDGETQEGSTLESLLIIRRLKIPNIIPVVDINGWAGFQAIDEGQIPYNTLKYYSTKGQGWGELEDTLQSHYAKVDEKLFKTWENARTDTTGMGSK